MSKVLDGVIGFAIGDAMGVPIEFFKREKCLVNPLAEMIGGSLSSSVGGTKN